MRSHYKTLNTPTGTYRNFSNFFPEGLKKGSADSKKRFNCTPFGVTLRGRNFTLSGAEDYRKGFSGMEKDDEIKGSGNSYDFGARMLDPRLGRWLTIDPQSGKQPSQSPYKAFFNSPLIWSDPDGETEFLRFVLKDEASGKSISFFVSTSNKVKTDGVIHYDEMNGMPYQNYYDYSHVTTITLTRDNKLTIKKTEETLKQNGVRFTDYVPGDQLMGTTAKKGSIYDPDNHFVQAGGFYMTGSGGQGTKHYSTDPTYVGNVDDLISAVGGLSEGGFTKKTPTVSSDEILKLMKMMSEAPEKADELVETFEQMFDGGDDTGSLPGTDKTASNTTTWTKYDGPSGMIGTNNKASDNERKSGDTLGGKKSPKHSWTDKAGKKVTSSSPPSSPSQIK